MLYRAALHAERERQSMFANDTLPLATIIGPLTGEVNGAASTEITDADPRIGVHLEVFIAGSYTWVPFAYIESIETEPPKKLRDLLWLPAVLRTTSEFRLQDIGEVLDPSDRTTLLEARRRCGAVGPRDGMGRRSAARPSSLRPEAAAAR